ncbi:transposase IS200-family protein, partial [Megasphaera sp. BL7]
SLMLLMAEMIFHLTFEHGLKNGAKNLLQDVLYVFRALDVVVVEDLLSNLLAWGSWWSFTLCHSVTVLIFVYPSMGHKVDSCNTDLHKLFYTPCKYHIVFAPKYRRQIIYGQIKEDIGKILRSLCNRKQVELIEGECCPDHIHILVAIPPHLSVSQFMGYLKSKSGLMIFDRHANLKYKYGNRHFWCRGYYVDTVGKYEGAIKEYIRNQLQEDIEMDTLDFKEYVDPFTGSRKK